MHRWGKPRYVRTDHGLEFKRSFDCLCQVLSIVHQKPTTGNSKRYRQVEHIFQTIKDAIHHGLSQWLDTFWSDHAGPALMLLRFTIARATRLAPFALTMGCDAVLPSVIIPPLPLPEEPTPWQERLYQEVLFRQVLWLQELEGHRCMNQSSVCEH